MAGSSPGTSVSAPSLSGERSGARDACPSPCNRGCAPLECTFELPKSFYIFVKQYRVDYLMVMPLDRDGSLSEGSGFELSLSNFVRTISTSSQVEDVRIQNELGDASQRTFRALTEYMKTIPSLKSLHLEYIISSRLSVSDAEAIFSTFGPHSTLQTGGVTFEYNEPTKAATVKVLVDALLQNQVLRQFKLRYSGATSRLARTEDAGYEGSVMRELNRYLQSPTNVLTELGMCKVDDDEVIQLADTLGLNKKLQRLWIERGDNSSHREGIGRIGEALRTNTVLEELGLDGNTGVGVEEMEALVGALVPDAASGLQPNTHLHTLSFMFGALEGREGMEQLATLLRSNTSLLHLDLSYLTILERNSENVFENVEMLFTALRFNTSLESLNLECCSGVGGKDVLGMIMDMLLHNRSLRKINLEDTGLNEDGDGEVVYAELRGRDKTIDQELEKAIRNMEHVPPNSARVFLCGDPEAGKTTLCKKWMAIPPLSACGTKSGEIDDDHSQLSSTGTNKNRMGFFIPKRWRNKFSKSSKPSKSTPSSSVLELALSSSAHDLDPLSSIEERTRGIEVHKMVWEDMNISVWDLAGQEEYHTFHDMVLPNRSTIGDCCFYFIVCNPRRVVQHLNKQVQMKQLEEEIYYWLVFIASNTRRSKSYLPHVTILMTHHDLWRAKNDDLWSEEKVFTQKMKHIIQGLRNKFKLFLEFDMDLEFIAMDNTSASFGDAMKLKQHVLQYLKKMSKSLPKTLKASVDFQSTIMKWSEDSSREPFVEWDVFSHFLFQEVLCFGSLKDVGNELLEKIKKHVAVSLHNGGHIMYFDEIDMVILNPHWFCQNIIGHILFHCSKLNDKYAIAANGIISQQDFKKLVLDGETIYKGRFKEILMIMTKLQICYEDGAEMIMIPSLLDGNPIPTNWEEVFVSTAKTFNYLGSKLNTADESITKLTRGFFPRLQVYLRNKFLTETYRLYSNSNPSRLFCKGISLIVDGVQLFILLDKEGSINIISRCCGGGDSRNRDVHKRIMEYVNDLRQTPTLGCPGVVFEEHIIFPSSLANALDANKLRCVSKKRLLEKVLRDGDLKYAPSWVDEEGKSTSISAKVLLGDEEWLDTLERRRQKVMDMDKVLDSKLPARNSDAPAASEPSNSDLVRKDSMKRFIADEFDSLKRLIHHNHEEVMKRLDELENNIMDFQEKLTSRVCSNIDNLMECLLQLNNSNIPKLPYIMESAGMSGKRILLKMVPGLKSYQLQFMCEHKGGFHIVQNQPGCEVEIGNDQTRLFGIVMYWGLTISVMLLKVGAHLTAGMGSMVPDLTREFATILDTPGLLDLAQPRGDILECLPKELKNEPHISLQDNEEAKAWLVQILGKKCPPGGIQRMFKLTQMVYTSNSNQKGRGIAWVCDKHRDKGEQDGSLRRM
ncbi:hypothetical protein KC19_1G143600 [Ceratodon purpureus]|uniref:C-terminal of Roc (COR) domain-containing protein n=1 Tax=Ceratodon purpureus TaxID=3225 RepID=A0A8T0J853_CERPU|nr:hypothetical protein KC19_1G143600 [Ceratodon purpureus]